MSSRRRPGFAVVGLVTLIAVAVAVVALVVIRRDRSTAAYSDRDRSDFLAACTADGGQPVQGTCECIYERLVDQVPYDRYREIDARLAAEDTGPGQPLELPDDVRDLVAGCVPTAG